MITTYRDVVYVVPAAMSVSVRRSPLITWDMSGSLWHGVRLDLTRLYVNWILDGVDIVCA